MLPPFASRAPVTFAIIVANLVVFVGEVIASRSFSSLLGVPSDVLRAFGANFLPLTLGLGQLERVVACCFVHGSLLHVAVNMWSLGQIGPYAEETVGSARFSVLYVVSGIVASLSSLFWMSLQNFPVPSVGASGAICGVMGAALVVGVRLEGWRSSIARQIGFWLLVIVVYGARATNIDNAAHLGGIAAGCVIATVWRRGIRYSRRATILSIGGAATVCVVAGLLVAWRAMTDPLASVDANQRAQLTQRAFERLDCDGAKRLLALTEQSGVDSPELQGLRSAVRAKCPPAGGR